MGIRKDLAKQANAVHEAGHVVARWYESVLPGVKSVTIVPKQQDLGSVTGKRKSWEESLLNVEAAKARIRVYFAGRIAELLCLGEGYLGSRNDIENATELARILVSKEGLWKEVGMVDVEQLNDEIHKQTGQAIRAILAECEKEATKTLRRRKQQILRVAFALVEQRTLKHKVLKKILGPRPKWKPKRGLLKRQKK